MFDHISTWNPPIRMALEGSTPEVRQTLRHGCISLMDRFNRATDGTLMANMDYAIVTGVRSGKSDADRGVEEENPLAHLTGKVAIVTGGGRGLGRAHALALANEGAAVTVNDLGGDFTGDESANESPAEEVASAIVAVGGRAATETTDISDSDGARGVVDAAVKAFGRSTSSSTTPASPDSGPSTN
jgi:short subunit dehydrogenase